jgi:hypothetical protein
MSTKKGLTLKEYIRERVAKEGVDNFKKRFDVRESTINHWARGFCLPRAPQMEKIVRMSEGRVSYATMIETFNRKHK